MNRSARPAVPFGQTFAEIAALSAVIFLYAGWLPPDVNEAHYLAKARHYWDPTWCRHDFFLQSADAHVVFYWTFGALAAVTSFPAAAWAGRVITWILLAWRWQRLSSAVAPQKWMSLLTGSLFIALLHIGHLSGEWVFGGVEAKGLAYVLVLWGLHLLVRDRWSAALAAFGGAAAFHVLVGGWAVVALGLSWLLSGARRPSWKRLVPGMIIGGLLSLPGLVPAAMLTANAPVSDVQEAQIIYVYERLPHHLVPRAFSLLRILLFGLLVVTWWMLRKRLRDDGPMQRLHAMAAGSLLLVVAGILLDMATVGRPATGAAWLRFYWFRLADCLVPLAVALSVGVLLPRADSRSRLPASLAVVAVAVACLLPSYLHQWRDRRPRAVQQQRVQDAGGRRHAEWVAVCEWIRTETPPDALFLTPRRQQTFKWYAQRAEVVNWKDIPQDAPGIVEWRVRMESVHPARDRGHGLADYTDDELEALAERWGARYLVLERPRHRRPVGFLRIYPNPTDLAPSFEVYDLRERLSWNRPAGPESTGDAFPEGSPRR